MSYYDDDRPRKSWREIDNMRNHSYYHDSSVGTTHRKSRKEEFEERRYKTELEKMFSGGTLPPSLAEKLGDTPASAASKKRHELIQKIRNEENPVTLMKEISELYGMDKELPKLEDVLVPAVEHEDVEIACAAMTGLIELKNEGSLKRGSLLKIKLRSVLGLAEDQDVLDKAHELLTLIS